ncbi:hypothetical protein RJ640_010535 [Escallonia rubra]|uniref:Uncharacterized protein n=1 Tax=Escallonia rubra TaxID=112253 RepID=A0AA88QRK3_9ASTE|nr:hypothetical protein RJ640_010535 [Escallonia rubra]
MLRSLSYPVAHTLFLQAPPTTKFPFIPYAHHHHLLHLRPFSCLPSGSSQFSPNSNTFLHKPFKRAQSDSDIQGLAMLRTEPSFCIYNTEDGIEEQIIKTGTSDRSVTTGDSIEAIGSGEFSFGEKSMEGIEEGEKEEEEGEEEGSNGFKKLVIEEIDRPVSPPMYIGTGFRTDGNGNEELNVEEYYKRMVREDPSNPFILRNYAQLLQSKGNLPGAEENYFRASLADPKDGEVLMQYATLVWQLHRNQDRASRYFERATHVLPNDSQILGAYASFLWEIDEDDNEDFPHIDELQSEKGEGKFEFLGVAFEEENRPASPPLYLAAGLGIDMAGFGAGTGTFSSTEPKLGEDRNPEEHHKRMLAENPCNPLFLRNYAQYDPKFDCYTTAYWKRMDISHESHWLRPFLEALIGIPRLKLSKGDLEGAEYYYSRAILADPGDGEIIAQYAKVVWELHHDQDKALSYFERAVQAAPSESHVLGAYAKFLWETDGDEERCYGIQSDIQVPLSGGVMTSAHT